MLMHACVWNNSQLCTVQLVQEHSIVYVCVYRIISPSGVTRCPVVVAEYMLCCG